MFVYCKWTQGNALLIKYVADIITPKKTLLSTGWQIKALSYINTYKGHTSSLIRVTYHTKDVNKNEDDFNLQQPPLTASSRGTNRRWPMPNSPMTLSVESLTGPDLSSPAAPSSSLLMAGGIWAHRGGEGKSLSGVRGERASWAPPESPASSSHRGSGADLESATLMSRDGAQSWKSLVQAVDLVALKQSQQLRRCHSIMIRRAWACGVKNRSGDSHL